MPDLTRHVQPACMVRPVRLTETAESTGLVLGEPQAKKNQTR